MQERTTTSSPRAAMAVAIVCTAMITAVMGLQASAALANTVASRTITPSTGQVGQPTTVEVTGTGDGTNALHVEYELPTASGCAQDPGSEQSRTDLTSLVETTPAAGSYDITSPSFTPSQTGTYCIYVHSDGNGGSYAPIPYPVYPPPNRAGPGGQAITFHVIDQRNAPQFAYVGNANGTPSFTTDASGNITLSVLPGVTLRFTRDPQPPSFCPQEASGVSYKVSSGAPAQATITLPNTTGPAYKPELSDAERGVVGRINSYRSAHGVGTLAISTVLDQAASAVARDSALKLAATGSYPFPPPFCDVIPQDFNWPGLGPTGSEDHSGPSAAGALAHWTDSSSRGTQTASSQFNAIGIGDGDGAWIVFYSSCRAGSEARCGMTSDQGDPSIPLPSARITATAPSKAGHSHCRTVKRGKKRVRICPRPKPKHLAPKHASKKKGKH